MYAKNLRCSYSVNCNLHVSESDYICEGYEFLEIFSQSCCNVMECQAHNYSVG